MTRQPVREGDEFGTVPKVALHFGIAERRLRQGLAEGELAEHPPAAGQRAIRVRLDEVRTWIAARGVPREW